MIAPARLLARLEDWAKKTDTGDRAELADLPDDAPIWREVQWKGSIPASGYINFSVQTSKTEAGLSTAPLPSTPLLVTRATTADLVAFTTSSNAVAQVFSDANVLPQVYLRLTILLNPSSDNLSTPILTGWRQLFDCVDSQ